MLPVSMQDAVCPKPRPCTSNRWIRQQSCGCKHWAAAQQQQHWQPDGVPFQLCFPSRCASACGSCACSEPCHRTPAADICCATAEHAGGSSSLPQPAFTPAAQAPVSLLRVDPSPDSAQSHLVVLQVIKKPWQNWCPAAPRQQLYTAKSQVTRLQLQPSELAISHSD
jgi:hypothetical protein